MFLIGLAVMWKIALSRPAGLRAEIRAHTDEIANLEAFLRANSESLRLADRIRIEEITRWVPTSLSPHEAKARILASAVQHGVVIDNLTIEEVRSLHGDMISTLQDVPVHEESSATLLPEEIEAMTGDGTPTAPATPIETEPILGQPFLGVRTGRLPAAHGLAGVAQGRLTAGRDHGPDPGPDPGFGASSLRLEPHPARTHRAVPPADRLRLSPHPGREQGERPMTDARRTAR